MKNELIIKKVFDKVAIAIISNVDEIYRDELLNAYKNYLIECYSEREFGKKDVQVYIEALIELESSKWKNEKQEAKLSMLLKDTALEKIRELSNNGYSYASSKISTTHLNYSKSTTEVLDKEVANECTVHLQELLPKVREFNKNLAANLVSEGILDYQYASGNSNCTSLRVGRLR